MKTMPLAACVGLSLLLAACPAPDEAPEATADLPETTEPAAPTITPTPEVLRVPVPPVAGSDVSGEAALREVGAQTSVQLTLRDAPPSSTLQAHVHQGDCQQQGPVRVPLDAVITDADGLGTSVTTLDLPLVTLTDGRHYVQAHAPGEEVGPPVACGDIPARQDPPADDG